jgi:hypothetical protein
MMPKREKKKKKKNTGVRVAKSGMSRGRLPNLALRGAENLFREPPPPSKRRKSPLRRNPLSRMRSGYSKMVSLSLALESHSSSCFLSTGVPEAELPQTLAEIQEMIARKDGSIVSLFPRQRTRDTTYHYDLAEKKATNHYRCHATRRFDGTKWVPHTGCPETEPIAGKDSYRRHVRETHLGIKRLKKKRPKKRRRSPSHEPSDSDPEYDSDKKSKGFGQGQKKRRRMREE